MATDDRQIFVTGTASAPAHWTVPGNGQIRPKTILASFDGSHAGSPYVPTIKITSDGGELVGIYPACQPIAAGGSAVTTWFLDGDDCCGQTSSGGGGGTITSVTSPLGTIAVTNSTGPNVNADLPATGVTAGTYGDSSHTSRVTVDAEGRLTSASSVLIAAPGTLTTLFDKTLLASAATIDTGANAIPAGYSGLMIYVIGRRDDAVFSGGFALQFNGDTGTNYDYGWTDQSNTVVTGIVTAAAAGTKVMEGPGANVGANRFGAATVSIPAYADTTAYKSCTSLGGFADGSTHGELVHSISLWRSTTAINQVTLTVGAGVNMIAGSRMTIYGLP